MRLTATGVDPRNREKWRKVVEVNATMARLGPPLSDYHNRLTRSVIPLIILLYALGCLCMPYFACTTNVNVPVLPQKFDLVCLSHYGKNNIK